MSKFSLELQPASSFLSYHGSTTIAIIIIGYIGVVSVFLSYFVIIAVSGFVSIKVVEIPSKSADNHFPFAPKTQIALELQNIRKN